MKKKNKIMKQLEKRKNQIKKIFCEESQENKFVKHSNRTVL